MARTAIEGTVTTVKIPSLLLKKVDRIGRETFRSRAQLIREALVALVEKEAADARAKASLAEAKAG